MTRCCKLSPYLMAVAMLLTFATSAPWAATIVANGSSCTLVDAITAANTNAAAGGCPGGDDLDSGGDIIELTADVTLRSPNNEDANGCPNGLPAVTSIIRINGNNYTIARGGAAGDRPWFRLLDSTAGILTLDHVTAKNGFLEGSPEPCDGGGINGNVTLINSTVSDNRIYQGNGGGINGTAILTNSTVSGNRVTYGVGGGINGTSTLMNSTVSDNCAGCYALATTLMNSMLAYGLPEGGNGGGISGSVTLINSTVSNNSAGGRMSIGGGLLIDGTAALTNSTVSGNSVSGDIGVGGGIHLYRGTLTLTNSTVWGNSTFAGPTGVDFGGSGGGIFSSGIAPVLTGHGGPVTLIHSTVAGNSATGPYQPPYYTDFAGAGIYSDSVTLVNTIVANNIASGWGGGPNPVEGDCHSTTIEFKGLNVIGDGSCGAESFGQVTGNPMLGPLADYGGHTLTQPLLPGSPAIDRIAFIPGKGSDPTNITIDQRGVVRPQPQGGDCDIGAFEYTSFPSNPVLDNFNRPNGQLGGMWSGATGLSQYKIVDNQVDVGSGGPVYWQTNSFGVSQEALLTLTNIDSKGTKQDLLLKVQSGPVTNYKKGAIEVLYNAKANAVQVTTWLPTASSFTAYPKIPVTFQNGDQMGGRVYANGKVEVYRNKQLVASVTMNTVDQAFFNSRGGHIGLWFNPSQDAIFDSFGGGTITP